LGRGFLTGQFKTFEDLPADDYRRNAPRFQSENFQKNLQMVKKIEKLAASKGCTPSQLALAWVLAQGDDVVPIPGTKRTKYLDENLGALNIRLSKEEQAQIEATIAMSAVSGDRYPPHAMRVIDR
jgi:aryl-alcohol dehydrogenase-like predicted oxidoreductase